LSVPAANIAHHWNAADTAVVADMADTAALSMESRQPALSSLLLLTKEIMREGRWLYSRRIIGIWNYQREQLRLAG
jgi:hypothetical protein